DLTANAILPREEYQQITKAFFNQPFDWRFFWKFDERLTVTLMNFATFTCAGLVLGALTMLRFSLLGFLYIIGPLVINIGVYKATSQGLSTWLKSLVAISSWKVFLAILLKV